ncbi:MULTISPECIES: adenine phosphoribosyltransferase [unclassified Psychrobacter]|uniref:adenine phosphoribosyltransferase n=1 Tax=unclassified Psychrobacter TaxID=196806 RepID=UPI0025F0259C|nr:MULTISPECIES: adenine phosphoribosyltransferase [unclassified Psychrobacter]
MSANAAVTSAKVNFTTDSINTLNTDHPFWQIIRTVPDFPKVGIDFYDITPLLRSHVNAVIDEMLAALPMGLLDKIDCLGAVEARGFIFASLLAGRLGKGMILLRKPGKLPPPVANKAYALEYGKDTLEMQNNLPPERVLLVDDILATGGTLMTAYELCRSAEHTVVGALVLLDLVDLHGEFPVPIYTVLKA